MITDLFQVVNSNKGCIVSLSICSIVKEEALSNLGTYSYGNGVKEWGEIKKETRRATTLLIC